MTGIDPKYAWSNKGAALTNLGNYDEAIKACDEAIRLDPTIPSSGTTRALFSKLLDGPPKRMLAFAKAEEEPRGYSE